MPVGRLICGRRQIVQQLFKTTTKCLVSAIFSLFLTLTLFSSHAHANDEKAIEALLAQPNSANLLGEVNRLIDNLDEDTPVETRIKLDSWKLQALPDEDTEISAAFAIEIYRKYDRDDYSSEEQYGRTIHEMVQAFAKTQKISLAYEIVQNLRQSVYRDPSNYLDYVIDLCLMEIYIETFDYARALDVEVSMMENAKYATLPIFQERKVSLLNEIAFLNNRLGNGEKALEYLDQAQAIFENDSYTAADTDLHKLYATNRGNRGRAYLLLGRYEEAEKMGHHVLAAGKQRQSSYMMALGHRLIGTAALNLGEYDRSRTSLRAGIALADKKKIATMQQYLYADYALNLEKLGLYQEALSWTRKKTALEIKAREESAEARFSLHAAEERALKSHEEVLRLKSESRKLKGVVISLLLLAVALLALFHFLRKSQAKLVESQKELVVSEKNAQIANQAKSEFLANMSHEIRTPMNGVLGMLEVLRRTKLDAQQMYYTDIINRSGQNLLNILTNILDLSKIEAGKTSLNLRPCNLKTTIEDVVNLFRFSAQEKKLEITSDFPDALPSHFIADDTRIKQILSNLIGNAIKFTEQGGIAVSTLGYFKNGKAEISITVRDTGIGIDQDKIDMIFEKFSQAESSTTRRYGGTGLGLTISRNLAELMGGNLTAASAIGAGTAITLSLTLEITEVPVIQDPEVPRPGRELLPAKKAIAAPHPKSGFSKPAEGALLNLLLVEDDEINRAVVKSHLNHPKIKITIAKNGWEAIQLYKLKTFDLIFMDVSMPVMDGLMATKNIREIETKMNMRRTPIICLTAHIMMGDRERFLQTGMDDYLSKPVKRDELLRMIKRWHNKFGNAKETTIGQPNLNSRAMNLKSA